MLVQAPVCNRASQHFVSKQSPARALSGLQGQLCKICLTEAIKPIWTCKCGASMFGHITQCTRCGKMKPEADLRFVQVWNIPPDVLKKPLQWCFSSDFNQWLNRARRHS